MRTYQEIWSAIKKLTSEEQWVVVKYSHADAMQTIINAVQDIKCAEQQARKMTDLPGYGRLKIRKEPAKMQVSFSLRNSGEML